MSQNASDVQAFNAIIQIAEPFDASSISLAGMRLPSRSSHVRSAWDAKAMQLTASWPIQGDGSSMDLKQVLAIRNAMVDSTDLRQPLNLDDQLLNRSGLSRDVGQAMLNLLQVTML